MTAFFISLTIKSSEISIKPATGQCSDDALVYQPVFSFIASVTSL